MTISRASTSNLRPVPVATFTGVTVTSSFVVPANCTLMDVVVVAGGQSGYGGADYTGTKPGGKGGQVVQQTVTVVSGETLTVTVGGGGTGNNGNGTNSSIAGTFGTITASATAGPTPGNNGTYVTGFGWLGGPGANAERVTNQAQVSASTFPGGGGCASGAWGSISGAGSPGAANSGGGGGADATNKNGGSGFVGIFVR